MQLGLTLAPAGISKRKNPAPVC